MKVEITSELLERRRQEIGGVINGEPLMNLADWARYLGFRSKAKNKNRALVTRYNELKNFLDGKLKPNGEKYSVGVKTLQRIAERIGATGQE